MDQSHTNFIFLNTRRMTHIISLYKIIDQQIKIYTKQYYKISSLQILQILY